MVTPDLKIVPLDVISDIPYIKRDGLHSQGLDPAEITALTGVMINEQGQIVLDPDFLGKTAVSGLPSMQSKQRKRSGESWMLISGYEGGEKTECNAKGKTLVNYN